MLRRIAPEALSTLSVILSVPPVPPSHEVGVHQLTAESVRGGVEHRADRRTRCRSACHVLGHDDGLVDMAVAIFGGGFVAVEGPDDVALSVVNVVELVSLDGDVIRRESVYPGEYLLEVGVGNDVVAGAEGDVLLRTEGGSSAASKPLVLLGDPKP